MGWETYNYGPLYIVSLEDSTSFYLCNLLGGIIWKIDPQTKYNIKKKDIYLTILLDKYLEINHISSFFLYCISNIERKTNIYNEYIVFFLYILTYRYAILLYR